MVLKNLNKLNIKKNILIFVFIFASFFSQSFEISKANEKVVIKVFSSLTCPHCANFHQKVVINLKNDYLNKNLVKFEHHSFPLDMAALNAEKILRCIENSEKKFEFLSIIYKKQEKWAVGSDINIINDSIKKIGKEVGLKDKRMDKCLSNEKIQDEILNENGLTGIVGPNGCGKSNIVEGLRWCMGETSAKSMRGMGMEDIIFSGTSNRPAKNISEVSIFVENSNKDGPSQYNDLDEIIVSRKIERDKGSKYYINQKEVRARDVQTFFADLSTGAHSPSLISQGKIGMLVTSKPVERRAILEEAAGISGIHARRHEAETRLNAAENNLKRADELKRQQEKQLENLKKQAEEATKYKEISKEVRSIEAGVYFLKIKEIEKEKKLIKEKLGEQDDEISAINIDLNHNTSLLEEENKKLSPLRDRKMENLAKLQKLNLEMKNLEDEELRFKNLQTKLQKSMNTIETDLEREKSISLDASLNEKRILEEKNELLITEKELHQIEAGSVTDLKKSKENLRSLQNELNNLIDKIESYIDENKKITKDLFFQLKELVNKITTSQEDYAVTFGKNETMKNDSIKRKERVKNIDTELDNWKNLKLNSEKMMIELKERKSKTKTEIEDNQKNPERIASQKGQNIQNLENTKKRNEELENELLEAEKKYNLISENVKNVQEKLTVLRENKARNEATIEGIEKRKKDLLYSVKNELNIDSENVLLSSSDLSDLDEESYPAISDQEIKLDEIKKQRESLGSVNLRADEETKKYQDEIKKMEDDRADLFSAIVKNLILMKDMRLKTIVFKKITYLKLIAVAIRYKKFPQFNY